MSINRYRIRTNRSTKLRKPIEGKGGKELEIGQLCNLLVPTDLQDHGKEGGEGLQDHELQDPPLATHHEVHCPGAQVERPTGIVHRPGVPYAA